MSSPLLHQAGPEKRPTRREDPGSGIQEAPKGSSRASYSRIIKSRLLFIHNRGRLGEFL